jgi:hypothetical protein
MAKIQLSPVSQEIRRRRKLPANCKTRLSRAICNRCHPQFFSAPSVPASFANKRSLYRQRAYPVSLIREDFERCHPGETIEELKRRASFSSEDRGLLRDLMETVVRRAAERSKGARPTSDGGVTCNVGREAKHLEVWNGSDSHPDRQCNADRDRSRIAPKTSG